MTQQTKWSVLQARLSTLEAQAARLRAELDRLQRTEFGAPCTGCGLVLATEADFAQHFVIPDFRYLNLGYCPVVGER